MLHLLLSGLQTKLAALPTLSPRRKNASKTSSSRCPPPPLRPPAPPRRQPDGPSRRRVGIKPDGRAIAREGSAILSPDGGRIGTVTSGGFGPSAEGPVAMGYVPPAHAKVGTSVLLEVRGKQHPAQIVKMPFHPHSYYRGQ